ncbi:MAG: hypothetical protein JWM16_5982 [Verrucomicrobiales bacterium]|nr:hypothetical protein [Verrucomicrobiales bacterium]
MVTAAYTDTGGTNLYFSAQADGESTNYLTAPIAWSSNEWRFIALTYSSSNSVLYLDGALTAEGPGVSVEPSLAVLTNGFLVGSDETGFAKAQGQFESLRIYDYPLNATSVSNLYSRTVGNVWPLPLVLDLGGGFTSSFPDLPGTNTGGGGGGGSFTNPPAYQHGSNDLWLEICPLGEIQGGELNLETQLQFGNASWDHSGQWNRNIQNEAVNRFYPALLNALFR